MTATTDRAAPMCPVCGSTEHEVYFKGVDTELTAAAVGQSRSQLHPGTILRCRQCGLGYQAKRPTSEALAALYGAQDVGTYLAEEAGRKWTAQKHWRLVEALHSGGHVLDVGSASGLFLEQACLAGWQVTGVEPSQKLCEQAEQRVGGAARVFCGTLESLEIAPDTFDVITLWDVLEHATEPRDFMGRCARVLKPGGTLVLNVPQIDSAMSRLLGKRWPLLLPEHFAYFTKDSLTRCGAAAGLNVLRFDWRPAAFSLGHVFNRLAEHGVPLAGRVERAVRGMGLGDWVLPVPLGEIVAVYQKPRSS